MAAQKLSLSQQLSQKLSPQQIQFIKLLQVPTLELETRIEQELEVNPALEEGKEETERDEYDEPAEESAGEDDLNLEDYLDDDYGGYKMSGDGADPNAEDKELPIAMGATLSDALQDQVGYLRLDERQQIIASQIVGSIDADGYLRRELSSIVNDLAFSQGFETDVDEVEAILHKVHGFDPPGVGARDLQECLLLQLERRVDRTESVEHAQKIIEECFDEFTRKHYEKIQKKLDLDEDQLRDAVHLITKLNPKPGGAEGSGGRAQVITPDFILVNRNGDLELALNSRNAPELRISRDYREMLDTYDKSDKSDKKVKEAAQFVKQKLDSARWFIDAIRQRQQTLLRTMQAIVDYQHEFFLEGDETNLRPMILKDIAERIGMDISTISRVANSKAVQTEFGIFPLKYFFSESIATESGEDVSSREVKAFLKRFIEEEDKRKPLSDEKLEKLLNDKGYTIARRTVAKYREQLGIPVARLRKEL